MLIRRVFPKTETLRFGTRQLIRNGMVWMIANVSSTT